MLGNDQTALQFDFIERRMRHRTVLYCTVLYVPVEEECNSTSVVHSAYCSLLLLRHSSSISFSSTASAHTRSRRPEEPGPECPCAWLCPYPLLLVPLAATLELRTFPVRTGGGIQEEEGRVVGSDLTHAQEEQ